MKKADNSELASIIATLMNHRLLILITTLVFVALGAAYAFFSPPIYQAGILIKVEDSNEPAVASANDILRNASPTFDVKSPAEGEIQILGSKLIVSRAVDALKLYITATPHYFPILGFWLAHHTQMLLAKGWRGMGGFVSGDESIGIGTFDVPREYEGRCYQVTAHAVGQYALSGPGLDLAVMGRVGVQERFQTDDGVIALLVDNINGQKGVTFDVTRDSRQATVEYLQKHLRISEQGGKSNVLSATVEGPDPARASATINQIGHEYLRQNADRKAVIAEKSLNFLQSQLPGMRAQMEEAEDKYNTYRNNHALLDLSEEGRQLIRQSGDAEAQVMELKRRREEFASHYALNHPYVIAIDQQIASTEAYLTSLNDRVRAMPLTEQGALRLLRDVRVSTELYSAMLNNIEQLQVIKAGRVGSVQLIDTADVPEKPIRPIKSLVLVVSAMLGLFCGGAIALARDLMFRGVTDPQELEAATGFSVFATIPLSDRQVEFSRKIAAATAEGLVLAERYPRDPAVESLRVLRSALQFAMAGARNNVILLAGPLPGIGKSFLSTNLAAVLATGGKRVLLVDGDLRKGHLSRYFDLPRASGLAEVLDGSVPLHSAIQRNVLPNLDFVETGEYPRNPAELLLRSRFSELMQQASRDYDIVLLDAPAILAVADTGVMAPSASLIFLIARFDKTRASELVEASSRLARTGAKVNGLLLNGFKGHGSRYGHATLYGSHAYVAHRYAPAERRTGAQ